ncbi:MAG: topoisomerase [Candidatus Thermoplasmatota archaeon]|nr:topoisomerase [Candidatus Thermoplasmatota archaeon]
MDYNRSLEELEKSLEQLAEDSKDIPILVEGEKDIAALRQLCIKGEIISINSGVSISNFCDWISRNYRKIIILTDWDRKGGQLCRIIKKNLTGRVSLNSTYREIFAKNTTIRTVEGLPSWLTTVREKLNKIK